MTNLDPNAGPLLDAGRVEAIRRRILDGVNREAYAERLKAEVVKSERAAKVADACYPGWRDKIPAEWSRQPAPSPGPRPGQGPPSGASPSPSPGT